MVSHNETPNSRKKRGPEPPNLRARPGAHSGGLEPLATSALPPSPSGAWCGITARVRDRSTMTHMIDHISSFINILIRKSFIPNGILLCAAGT